jgi:hypothetical protein
MSTHSFSRLWTIKMVSNHSGACSPKLKLGENEKGTRDNERASLPVRINRMTSEIYGLEWRSHQMKRADLCVQDKSTLDPQPSKKGLKIMASHSM